MLIFLAHHAIEVSISVVMVLLYHFISLFAFLLLSLQNFANFDGIHFAVEKVLSAPRNSLQKK